jgi:hypothetical protein
MAFRAVILLLCNVVWCALSQELNTTMPPTSEMASDIRRDHSVGRHAYLGVMIGLVALYFIFAGFGTLLVVTKARS